MLDRRRFLAVLAAAASGVRVAAAQPRVPRVGLVSAGTRSLNALVEGLRESGYVPGQSILVEHRRTEGRAERYDGAVAEVLKSGVDVLVTGSTHGLTAARAATRTVPIVAVDLETDPVAAGFVTSLARPGGNITGFFLDLTEFSGKLLQLVKEAVPDASRVAALHDPVIGHRQLQVTETAARAVDITVHAAPIRKAADVETAIAGAVQAGARALVVLSAPLMRDNQVRIDQAALRYRLPSITVFALLANGVGFMSYGPDLDDMYRRSGAYAARVIRGAPVSDLPIERPSRFEFAVNARTARTLGLTVPPALLLRADRVIE